MQINSKSITEAVAHITIFQSTRIAHSQRKFILSEEEKRQTQGTTGQCHLRSKQDHGADTPGNYAKARVIQGGDW